MKGVLILSLEEHRHNGETADAGGEEAEEDVGGGDQPEGKDVDHGVAVQGAVGRLGIRPVDPVKGKCLVNIGAIRIFFYSERILDLEEHPVECRRRHSHQPYSQTHL